MILPTLDALAGFLHDALGARRAVPPPAMAPAARCAPPRSRRPVLTSPFDEHLTTGDNVPLAAALGLRTRGVSGTREGRPLGMIGDVDPLPVADALTVEVGGPGVRS